MTRFPVRVLSTLRERGLVEAGDRVLVAFSGGPDSTALLEVLGELLPRLGAEVAGVAHVHHGMRGADADHDLQWCRDEAARRALPFAVRHVDVPGEARRRRWSVERTAHHLRHAALRDVAAALDCTRVALGHTLDDQAETVVLRWLRGAGTRGLGGMWPRRGLLIRPLIDVSRTQVEQFLVERGLSSVGDVSNRDTSIPRNRVRHEILPVLTAVAGPRLPRRLARQAQVWRDEETYLTAAAAPFVARAVNRDGGDGRVQVALGVLSSVPEGLQSRVLRGVARDLLDDHQADAGAVERLGRLARLRTGRIGRLGPWAVERRGAFLDFCLVPAAERARRRDGSDGAGRVDDAVVVPISGGESVTLDGWRLSAEADATTVVGTASDNGAFSDTSDVRAVTLDADALGSYVLVRTWRPGDRLRPRGLGGSQKLQDLFVNRKVPRADRKRLPVVTTPDGRVVWVVGHAVDEAFAAGATTTRVVILRATHPGGKA